MMRRWGIFFLLAGVIGFSYIGIRNDGTLLNKPQVNAHAALVMEADSGNILYESNADEALPPASMSKMMTELLVLEEIHSSKRYWNEPVKISSYAANIPGSKIGVKAGDKLSIRELFDAMVVHSANDAAVALAEHLSGTERKFVERMNQKARKIGLSTKTVFANSSGLPSRDLADNKSAAASGETVMTARDIARLASFLISTYPEVLETTRMPEVKLSTRNVTLQATNLMLPGKSYAYIGNDGLKTGYTDEAGYCFAATAIRDGTRLITVVMGTQNSDTRFIETEKLLTFGFTKTNKFVKEGQT